MNLQPRIRIRGRKPTFTQAINFWIMCFSTQSAHSSSVRNQNLCNRPYSLKCGANHSRVLSKSFRSSPTDLSFAKSWNDTRPTTILFDFYFQEVLWNEGLEVLQRPILCGKLFANALIGFSEAIQAPTGFQLNVAVSVTDFYFNLKEIWTAILFPDEAMFQMMLFVADNTK